MRTLLYAQAVQHPSDRLALSYALLARGPVHSAERALHPPGHAKNIEHSHILRWKASQQRDQGKLQVLELDSVQLLIRLNLRWRLRVLKCCD